MAKSKEALKEKERRRFPRLPVTSVVFKTDAGRIFAVSDLSPEGMGLYSIEGAHSFKVGQLISGVLRFMQELFPLEAKVMWVQNSAFGVSWEEDFWPKTSLMRYLQQDELLFFKMKDLHAQRQILDLPEDLKYWFACDARWQLMVWTSERQNHISHFEWRFFNRLLEWSEECGLRSGIVSHQKNEILFDQQLDLSLLELAKKILNHFPSQHLKDSDQSFLEMRLIA